VSVPALLRPALRRLKQDRPRQRDSGAPGRPKSERRRGRRADQCRLGSDPRTKEFLAKRTASGNSRKEIMRMLQRYIARELYPLIIDALRPALPGD
jgi:transposase